MCRVRRRAHRLNDRIRHQRRWHQYRLSKVAGLADHRQSPGRPFESAPHDSGVYVRWYADLLWLFVPIQGKIAELGATLKEYPPVTGGSLSGGLNCKAVQIQNAVDQLESLSTSRN